MKLAVLSVAALFVCATSSSGSQEEPRVRYDGFKVLRTTPKTDGQAEYLAGLEGDMRFSFWTGIRLGGAVDIMAGPLHVEDLVAGLNANGIEYSVMIEDVQRLTDQRKMPVGGRDMDWESYHPIEDMYGYFDYLLATYDDVAGVQTIGQSLEGTDMKVIQICRGGNCDNGRPDMYIEGGIHAREWISSATVMFLVRELVEGSGAAGGENADLVDNLNWHILPVTNPDGYLYTQTTDRLWRKTRSDYPECPGSCMGVDPNRNWEYEWGTGGSSSNCCSDTFKGPSAFSEIELQNVAAYTSSIPNLIFFNDVHSYSQLVLTPWGWTAQPAPGDDERATVFQKGVEATFAVHGTEYTVICVTCQFGVSSGGSVDYALGTLDVKYTMAHELRDTGEFGFLLPADQIIPTGEEIWAFHVSVARDIIAETTP